MSDTQVDGAGLQFAKIKRRPGRPRKIPEPLAPPPAPVMSSPTNQVQPVAPQLRLMDVIQVTAQHHQNYGTIFIVGDIKPPQVHGFMIIGNGEKRFVTVEDGQYARVGRSFVGARNTCSQEWLDKHKPA